MKTMLLLAFLLLFLPGLSSGQVVNDHLENRLDLPLNAAPILSNTAYCTVERACVSEALEGNCIKFHNDQWYQFTTAAAGTYYLNVGGQDCRDIQGVQLLVLEGIPCQPETYQIVACVSLGTQDDIYLQLDSLKANYTYLLNVDGYLHDFCQFSIQLSTTPYGIPARHTQPANQLAASLTGRTIHLAWSVTEHQAQEVMVYRVLRRYEKESRYSNIQEIGHQRDTYGRSALRYSYTDTVAGHGAVHYKLIAQLQDQTQVQLGETQERVMPNSVSLKSNHVLLDLRFKIGTPFSVYILRTDSKQVLKKSELVFSKQHRLLRIDTDPFLQQGIRQIEIRTTDHRRKKTQSQVFDLL